MQLCRRHDLRFEMTLNATVCGLDLALVVS